MMAHAEIHQVWPRDGRVRIIGRLAHDTPPDDASDWQLLLILRDHEDQQLRYDAPLDEDGGFDTSLAVDDVALDGLPSATWDMHLTARTASGETRLRVGRHLDDIEHKKKIMIFPAQSVTSDEDATVVRPFYTAKNNLSLECLPGDIDLRPGEIDPWEWID